MEKNRPPPHEAKNGKIGQSQWPLKKFKQEIPWPSCRVCFQTSRIANGSYIYCSKTSSVAKLIWIFPVLLEHFWPRLHRICYNCTKNCREVPRGLRKKYNNNISQFPKNSWNHFTKINSAKKCNFQTRIACLKV